MAENRVSRFIFSTEAVLIQDRIIKVKGYKINKETRANKVNIGNKVNMANKTNILLKNWYSNSYTDIYIISATVSCISRY